SIAAGALLFERLVEPGDRVIVESPSYDRTLLPLPRLGAELTAVPIDADGINLSYLEETLELGPAPKFAHIIPTFHNPAGATLSDDKRHRVVEHAADYDLTIFDDDAYADVYFEAHEPLPTMLPLD